MVKVESIQGESITEEGSSKVNRWRALCSTQVLDKANWTPRMTKSQKARFLLTQHRVHCDNQAGTED